MYTFIILQKKKKKDEVFFEKKTNIFAVNMHVDLSNFNWITNDNK